MADLHNPEFKDFLIVDSQRACSKKVRKVHCTFYRFAKKDFNPKRSHYQIIDIPEEVYNECFRKGV